MFKVFNGTFPTQQWMSRPFHPPDPHEMFSHSPFCWSQASHGLDGSERCFQWNCRPAMGRGPRRSECLVNGHFNWWGHDRCWNIGVAAVGALYGERPMDSSGPMQCRPRKNYHAIYVEYAILGPIALFFGTSSLQIFIACIQCFFEFCN